MSGPTLQPATPILAKPMDSPKSRDMRAAPARAVAEPADAASPGAGPLEAEPLDPKPLEAEPLEAGPLEAELIEDELIEAELIEAERIEAPASPGEFPIQPAKVQRPFLRQETLERDRLLDWLHRRIHSRLVLVTAEAGYGKTTLLADFSRRTRLRTAWYRLDELDRNTISFLHYLVAAGREIDPGFAPGTAALLRELGTMAVSQDRIAETFLRELGRLGTEATVLIIDDYHLVDDVPDVRRLMRQVVASAPERLTIVLIGRRRPTLPLARLRSLGEVAELAASDLRFSLDETERLFRDTYGQPLEADVLSDLTRRTEGWAASLELVRTALHNRNAVEIRSFVRSLNGASQELYDYLAEEVVGDLELEAQQFLMRTAILQIVRPDLAAVASGLDADLVQDHIRAAERLGLLGGRGERAPRSHRYHPLVRDFLLHRLEREIGADGLAALHLTVARHADGTDWVLAAHHYAEARSGADVHRVIASSLAEIMGRGEFALAESYLNRFPPEEPGAAFEVILSRLDYSRSQTARALDRASTALEMARGTATEEAVLANVMAMAMLTGDIESARDYAEQLARGARDGNLRAIARNLLAATATSVDGNVQDSVNRLSALVVDQRAQGLDHYAAVTSINLAVALRVLGHQQAAVDAATEALGRLDALGEMRPEAYAARSARAGALAHLGSWTAAESDLRVATAAPHDLARREALIEAADIYAWYHSPTSAADSLAAAEVITAASLGLDSMWRVARAHLLVRSERLQEAQELLSDLPLDRTGPAPGQKARRLLIHAELAFLRREPGAISLALVAAHHAHQQQAGFWARCADLMAALASGDATANAALADRLETDPGTVAVMAEYVVLGLSTFNDRVLDLLALEVCRRPERWLPLLRPLAASAPRATALRAAALIERIGSWDDVRVLRKMARRLKLTGHDRDIGRRLARALSAPVYVEDFGLISVTIGDRSLRGSDIRRKVLALLCYLLTRPQLAATKDQVLEALWPDQDPEAASNSLNQTVYFLRRILDERYEDDISAPYITHSADVLRLDQGLVNSASREFASRLIGQPGAPDPETVERLSILYRGRFALDFEYEEWAAVYRDSLHASYLEAVERAIRDDISGGHYGRAIGIAQRVLAVDREAEQVELSLLRLFQLSGAHSAAAEQYANYASRLRNDLGIEPPPFADLWADR